MNLSAETGYFPSFFGQFDNNDPDCYLHGNSCSLHQFNLSDSHLVPVLESYHLLAVFHNAHPVSEGSPKARVKLIDGSFDFLHLPDHRSEQPVPCPALLDGFIRGFV